MNASVREMSNKVTNKLTDEDKDDIAMGEFFVYLQKDKLIGNIDNWLTKSTTNGYYNANSICSSLYFYLRSKYRADLRAGLPKHRTQFIEQIIEEVRNQLQLFDIKDRKYHNPTVLHLRTFKTPIFRPYNF